MFERNNGLSTKSLYDKSAEVAISSSRLQGEQERRRHTTLHDRGTDNHYDDDDDDDEFLDRNNYVEALAGHQVYAHFKLAEVVTSSRILRGDQDRRRTTLHDRETDSHYDGSQDRKSHVEGLAENVNQSLRYRIDENDHKDEDVYFDDESAEVVISTLRLGDNQESGSLFANSNWFAFDDEKVVHEQSSSAVASQSQDTGGGTTYDGEITANKNGNNLVDSATYEAHGSLERDDEPTLPAEGRTPPRIGNIGHMTRIANKLIEQGANNTYIESYLQDDSEWVEWHTGVLTKRNTLENISQWACGRPATLHDRGRDSDDDDYQDRDYDVAALANNLSQAFRYGIYENDDNDEALGSLERDDEDVYFDDESAEVVISSLRLGDDQEGGSLFTNSNWFAFEDEKVAHEQSTSAVASESPDTGGGTTDGGDITDENVKESVDSPTYEVPESKPGPDDTAIRKSTEDESTETETSVESDKPTEWIEWRESVEPEPSTETSVITNVSDETSQAVNPEPSSETSVVTNESTETCQDASTDSLPNGNLEATSMADDGPKKAEVSAPSSATEKPEAAVDSGGRIDVGGNPVE